MSKLIYYINIEVVYKVTISVDATVNKNVTYKTFPQHEIAYNGFQP